MQEVGYQHGKTVFDVWSRSGVVEKMLKDRHQEEFYNTQSKNNVRKKDGGKNMGMLQNINKKEINERKKRRRVNCSIFPEILITTLMSFSV